MIDITNMEEMKQWSNPMRWLIEGIEKGSDHIVYYGRGYTLEQAKRVLRKDLIEIKKEEKREEIEKIKKERMAKMLENRIKWVKKSCEGNEEKMSNLYLFERMDKKEKMEVTPSNYDEKMKEYKKLLSDIHEEFQAHFKKQNERLKNFRHPDYDGHWGLNNND